jgi:hypothetical protein
MLENGVELLLFEGIERFSFDWRDSLILGHDSKVSLLHFLPCLSLMNN